MSETKPAEKWIVGEIGSSFDNEPAFYVRTGAISALEVMRDGPDIALCADKAIANRIGRLPLVEEALRLATIAVDATGSEQEIASTKLAFKDALRRASLSEAR